MAQLTGTNDNILGRLSSVLNIYPKPPLARKYAPQNPQEMGDWMCDGNDIVLRTAFLTPQQIAEMREKLSERVVSALEEKGVDGKNHEFFVSQVGRGYYSKDEEIVLPRSSLEFLSEKGIEIDASDIVDHYHEIQMQRLEIMKSLEDRINALSGYPVWSSFDYAANGGHPVVRLTVPEAKIEIPEWEPPYNYGAHIEQFISDAGLGKHITYNAVEHRDGHNATLTISGATPEALESIITQLETKNGEEFKRLMLGMILKASPQSVVSALNHHAFTESLIEMGSGSVDDLAKHLAAKPNVLSRQELAALVAEYDTTADFIEYCVQQEHKSHGKPENPWKESLDQLNENIPALAPYIEEQRQGIATRSGRWATGEQQRKVALRGWDKTS